MKKKGVISVFIIIGIFILAVVALIISMYQGVIPKPGFLRNEADSITTYTESCLDTITHQAVDIMSVQGGYINLPEELKKDELYLDFGFKVPHWYNKGYSYAPSVLEMQEEMNNYIEENLKLCINNFEAFPQFNIVPLSDIKVNSRISESRIAIKTEYKLQVAYGGDEEKTILDEFNVDVKSNLGKMANLGRELMSWENRDFFLENYTDEMIACSDYLPYEGMELDCSPKIWKVSDMKKYTQNLIMYNIHYLMFENTDYTETGMKYYDKQYKVDFTNNDYKDFKVEVIYNPEWDMGFDVNPSSNGVTKPKEFALDKYLMSCVKLYHHKYTLEYPVMFQITDVNNPTNKFHFATPVIMRRGIANRFNEVRPWESEFDETGSRAYCSNTTSIFMHSVDSTGQIFSTPSLKNNRQYGLRVFAKDTTNNQMLPDVNISYQCVNFKCDIGTTAHPKSGMLYTGGLPMLNAKFPECLNGLVIAQKTGYQKEIKQVTVGQETDAIQVDIKMSPLKKFNYIIKVIEDHNGLIRERDLNEDEIVMMTIKEKNKYFEENIVYPSEVEYFSELNLMVGDFKYELDIKLVSEDEYLGGLLYNWTVNKNSMQNGRYVIFYVIKKDPLLNPQSPEDYQEVYNYAIENSDKYPPKVR